MDFDATQIIKDIAAIHEDYEFRNFVAQAHSRSILRGLGAPASEWPSYSRNVDETLHYTAHYLLEQGLRLKESKLDNDKADGYIREGAEILEFLYATAPMDHPEQTEELFNAALGYYIAGYYARAYVLMKDLEVELKLPQHLELLKRLFLKDLGGFRQLISEFLLDSKLSDKVISESLRSGKIAQDEAISHILQASLNRAFSYFIEYPKSGHRPLYEKACEILEQGIKLAKKTYFVDWWWLLYCSMHLFEEYDANSLWRQLAPMDADDPNGRLVRPYIRNSFRHNVPVIELWRSQTKALPIINEPQRRSYCLRMPTSAGKTRIAELAILRFLLDHADEPEAKCAYIAPFRALAVEVEKTLQESFGPLGIRVSEIYGGFELSPLERLLIEKTKILVATPEKFDAFIRYVPELAGTIKLIIMDEGHIISPTERGLRYEFFVHRLVRRYLATDTRIFFLSAVLPNVQEFAEWITGREDGIIESDWRPSRLMLGELQWNGSTVRIEYTHVLREQLGHECFVPNFIRQLRGEALRGTRRRNPFPNDMKEVLAIAAMDFAQRGLTLVFVPQQRSAEPFGSKVLEVLRIRQVIARRDGSDYSLPISQNKADLLDECISVARETMGDDSKMIGFLEAGFVVHHGGLPHALRSKLEELVRSEGVHLVIATTTLAQGVNFPIQTILVRGLEHGFNRPVNPMTFWNICGRAGRGGKENEGQILFAVDLTKEDRKRGRDKRLRQSVIDELRQQSVISALKKFLERVVKQWKNTHPTVNVAELCQALANNELHWLDNTTRESWLDFDFLDAQILALTEEFKQEEITPDDLQEALQHSLLFIQLRHDPATVINATTARDMLFARLKYIRNRYPTRQKRQQYYRIGLPLADCELIEQKADYLLELFQKASEYQDWQVDERVSHLAKICSFLLELKGIEPEKTPPDIWPLILKYWLCGNSANDMIKDSKVSNAFSDSPAKLSQFIDDLFVFRMPWGLNSLMVYLKDRFAPNGQELSEERDQELHNICSYYSGFLKHGVHHPVALCLLSFGVHSRVLSLEIAKHYPYSFEDANSVLIWFLKLDKSDFLAMELQDTTVDEILVAQKNAGNLHHIQPYGQASERFWIEPQNAETADSVQIGDRLVILPNAEWSINSFSVYTLWGELVGNYQWRQGELPLRWSLPQEIDIRVSNIKRVEGGVPQLEISVEVV